MAREWGICPSSGSRFEQLFGTGAREFDRQKFKNSNARGGCWGYKLIGALVGRFIDGIGEILILHRSARKAREMVVLSTFPSC